MIIRLPIVADIRKILLRLTDIERLHIRIVIGRHKSCRNRIG